MKKLLLVLAALAASSPALAQEHAHVSTPIDGNPAYHLALDKEFTSPGIPPGMCPVAWGACNAPSIPYNAIENDCYDPARQSIPGDGYLYLSQEQNQCTIGAASYAFRAGTLRTASAPAGQGYIEVRAKIPNFSGVIPNWPAIWLVGPNWPAGGEIDIFEGMTGKAFATYHWKDAAGAHQQSSVGVAGDWTGWHVFAVWWQPTFIRWYYDGAQVAEFTSSQGGIVGNWMYLIVNQAMGGAGGPQVVQEGLKIDYMHWYSASPNVPTVQPEPGYAGLGDAGPAICQ